MPNGGNVIGRSVGISVPNEKLREPLAVYTGLDRPLLFTSSRNCMARRVSPLVAV